MTKFLINFSEVLIKYSLKTKAICTFISFYCGLRNDVFVHLSMNFSSTVLLLFICCYSSLSLEKHNSKKTYKSSIDAFDILIPNWRDVKSNDKLPPSVTTWQSLNVSSANDGQFTVLSLYVFKGGHEGTWYIPSQSKKYSIGWNRSNDEYLHKPTACTINMFGVALNNGFEDYARGGTGNLQLSYESMSQWVKAGGHHKKRFKPIHCYYMSNQNFGNDFMVRCS